MIANNEDADEMLHVVAYHLGIHRLVLSYLLNAVLKCCFFSGTFAIHTKVSKFRFKKLVYV